MAGESAVQHNASLFTGVMISLGMLAAFVVAAALLDANNRNMDHISADTILILKVTSIVWKKSHLQTLRMCTCTSMCCKCSNDGKGTTFIPVPKNSNMDKGMKKRGLNTSLTGVDNAPRFFIGDPKPL